MTQQLQNSQKYFALIGAAGYVAVRHLRAIKETGNILLTALDKFDCVGILDSYFPETDFFVEFERFDRHLDKLRRTGLKIDYVSICTPNYLHDAHIRFALKQDTDAICEKPVVLNPWNIDALQEFENETGRKINNILQLRLHPAIIRFKQQLDEKPKNKIYDVDLTYITARGKWYFHSWKGEISKSGGIATNIGVHFFDLLIWLFGKVKRNTVHLKQEDKAAGFLELENANIRWFLSADAKDLPKKLGDSKQSSYRSITIDNEELEFSNGFTDLHTTSYFHVLQGKGFTLADVKPSIQTVYEIRNATPVTQINEYHPILKQLK